MKALLLSSVMALWFAGAARADIIFSLPTAGLTTTLGGSVSAGTLTGSFITNDDLTTVTSWDITASTAGSFAGFRYTPANSNVTASLLPDSLFQIDTPGPDRQFSEIRLFFNEPITGSGASISGDFSSEYEPSGGDRFLAGDVVAAATPATAVPEPASLALLGLGVAGLAAVRRRRAA